MEKGTDCSQFDAGALPNNVVHTCDHPEAATMASGAACVVRCNDGYRGVTLLQSTMQCSADGLWTGSPPICDAEVCTQGTILDNSPTSCTGKTVGQSCDYTCNDGFTVTGTHICGLGGSPNQREMSGGSCVCGDGHYTFRHNEETARCLLQAVTLEAAGFVASAVGLFAAHFKGSLPTDLTTGTISVSSTSSLSLEGTGSENVQVDFNVQGTLVVKRLQLGSALSAEGGSLTVIECTGRVTGLDVVESSFIIDAASGAISFSGSMHLQKAGDVSFVGAHFASTSVVIANGGLNMTNCVGRIGDISFEQASLNATNVVHHSLLIDTADPTDSWLRGATAVSLTNAELSKSAFLAAIGDTSFAALAVVDSTLVGFGRIVSQGSAEVELRLDSSYGPSYDLSDVTVTSGNTLAVHGSAEPQNLSKVLAPSVADDGHLNLQHVSISAATALLATKTSPPHGPVTLWSMPRFPSEPSQPFAIGDAIIRAATSSVFPASRPDDEPTCQIVSQQLSFVNASCFPDPCFGVTCIHGVCDAGTCACEDGWAADHCDMECCTKYAGDRGCGGGGGASCQIGCGAPGCYTSCDCCACGSCSCVSSYSGPGCTEGCGVCNHVGNACGHANPGSDSQKNGVCHP